MEKPLDNKKLQKLLEKILKSDDYIIYENEDYEYVCPECVRKREMIQKILNKIKQEKEQ